MSARIETRQNTYYARLLEHLRTPLFRNGYALALSSAATSAIGLLYWILAARAYPTDVVGINSAAISAMMFLAGVSELNLMSALIRFTPTAGRSTPRFVISAYLVSLVISSAISFTFVNYLPDWSPAFQFLKSDPKLLIWFMISTMAWCIFVLQDSVLTGLRQVIWVPMENTIYSVAKILIMMILASSAPSLGIFASWSISLIIAIVPTNFLIFKWLIPNHVKAYDQINNHIEPGQVIHYVATDYVGSLMWLACTTLLPVIVTTVAGATANAAYYLSWTIVNSLYIITPNMGASLVVEAAQNQQKLGKYSYRVFFNTLKLVAPAALLLAIGAPFVLTIFGKSYSSQGTTLLRLLALSVIPNIINSLFISVARVQRRMRAVVVTLGSLAFLVLGLGYALLKVYGIVGVGVAWIVGQTIVACVIFPTQLRTLWAASGDFDIETRLASIVAAGKVSLARSFYYVAKRSGLFPTLAFFLTYPSTQKKYERAMSFLADLSRSHSWKYDSTCTGEWKIHHVANTSTGITVAFMGMADQAPSMVLKIPGDQPNAMSLMNHCTNLYDLYKIECLGEWRKLLPVIVTKSVHAGQFYLVERTIPGLTANHLIQSPQTRQAVMELAASAISELHRQTINNQVVDEGMLQRWVYQPLSTIRSAISDGKEACHTSKAIDRIAEELHSAMVGKKICTSWIHGDYCPPNVIVQSDHKAIAGILDWDLAKPGGLPQLDQVHWVLSTRMALHHQEMGAVVRELLLKEDWRPDERQIIETSPNGFSGRKVDLRLLLLLAWLSHIHANLTKTSRFLHHPLWVTENILPVLQVFGTPEDQNLD